MNWGGISVALGILALATLHPVFTIAAIIIFYWLYKLG